MQTTKMIGTALLMLCGLGNSVFSDEVRDPGVFEGVLTYQLQTGGREWKIEHQVREGGSCTDIYLGTLKFQSVLQLDRALYLVDVLGKRIVPIGHMGMGPGTEGMPEREGNWGEPPEGFSEENMPPPPPDGKPGGRGRGPDGDHGGGPGGPMPMQLADPEEPTGEGIAFEVPSLKFKFKAEKRKVEMEGIAGYGILPPQVFQQFKDVQELGPVIAGTLNQYQLIPVSIEIAKHKESEAVDMQLVSIESKEVPASVLEFPEDYAMKMGMPGGPPGGSQRQDSGRGRGGPPPGGGRGQGMGMGGM